MISFKKILVPTDFSANSLQAYEFVQQFTKTENPEVHILHVVESVSGSSGIFDENTIDHDRILGAEEDLERFINKISNSDMNIKRAVKIGKPCEQIIKYANGNHVDIIVIASHGWSNLFHLTTGSVTNNVLRYAEVPVICVKTNTGFVKKEAAVNRSILAENWVG